MKEKNPLKTLLLMFFICLFSSIHVYAGTDKYNEYHIDYVKLSENISLPQKSNTLQKEMVDKVVKIVRSYRGHKYDKSFFPIKLNGKDGIYLVDKMAFCHRDVGISSGSFNGCESMGRIYVIFKERKPVGIRYIEPYHGGFEIPNFSNKLYLVDMKCHEYASDVPFHHVFINNLNFVYSSKEKTKNCSYIKVKEDRIEEYYIIN